MLQHFIVFYVYSQVATRSNLVPRDLALVRVQELSLTPSKVGSLVPPTGKKSQDSDASINIAPVLICQVFIYMQEGMTLLCLVWI